MLIFTIKYRDGTGNRVGAPITGSIPLELAWSIIPFFISMGIFGWATLVFFHLVRAPDQTLEIYSTGKRWMWRFQHIDGKSEINQLHVPLGRPVKVIFTSEDVLHSLYIPSFRVKADAIPGRYSSVWFTPTRVGEYHLFCAEYCGTEHALMRGTVVVMEPEEWARWNSQEPRTIPADAGKALFEQFRCASCHKGAAERQEPGSATGPALAGVYGSLVPLKGGGAVLADEQYLRDSILNPTKHVVAGFEPVMPSFKTLLSESEVLQLIAYLKSMSE